MAFFFLQKETNWSKQHACLFYFAPLLSAAASYILQFSLNSCHAIELVLFKKLNLIFPFIQRIQYAKTKSDIIAKADGTFVPREKRKRHDDKGITLLSSLFFLFKDVHRNVLISSSLSEGPNLWQWQQGPIYFMQLSNLENQKIILFFLGYCLPLKIDYSFSCICHMAKGWNGFRAFVTDNIEEGKVLINLYFWLQPAFRLLRHV